MAESKGLLVVTVRDAACNKVLQGASIILTGSCGSCTGISNAEGIVNFSIPTPSVANSYTPNPRERPYVAVDLRIVMAGYVTVSIVGEQVFPNETTRQIVMMGSLDQPNTDGAPAQLERVIMIPEHHLYTASDAPRVEILPDSELVPSKKAVGDTIAGVPKQVGIPKSIRVHLGPPDADAQNVAVPFTDYIKNVTCSETYPTWPEQALRSNVDSETALALNRLHNRWYPSQGYDFDITNSPAYDQQYVHERGIFDRVNSVVDDYFANRGSTLGRGTIHRRN